MSRRAINHIHIDAGSIYLLLSIRQGWVHSRSCRPVPNPVQRVGLAGWRFRWERNVLLAPEIGSHELVCLMRVHGLAMLGDLTTVYLVATAIVKILGRQEDAAPVTSCAFLVPDIVYVKKPFIVLWLRRPIYIYCPTIPGFPSLVLG